MPRSALTLAVLCVLALPAAAQDAGPPLTIEGIGQSRTVDCGGHRLAISGAGHRLTVTGRCAAVEVEGTDHEIALEAAGALEVSGQGNRVTLAGPTASLAVDGSDQRVNAAIKGEDGPARVEVAGADSRLELDLRSAARIEVAGSGHNVAYRLAPGVPGPRANISGFANKLRKAP